MAARLDAWNEWKGGRWGKHDIVRKDNDDVAISCGVIIGEIGKCCGSVNGIWDGCNDEVK
jgi:hypothetical protein